MLFVMGVGSALQVCTCFWSEHPEVGACNEDHLRWADAFVHCRLLSAFLRDCPDSQGQNQAYDPHKTWSTESLCRGDKHDVREELGQIDGCCHSA